ncbi:MAG: PAS domain-containing protein [Planctomycetota bacterium]
MSKMKQPLQKRSINLYKFIRLIVGDDVPDRYIARQWKMHEKNFHEFKTGVYPVPRIERLIALARVLRVNEHVVFAVAAGMPSMRAYNIIKTKKMMGKGRLTNHQLDAITEIMGKSKKEYQKLFFTHRDAVFTLDVKTDRITGCNEWAEQLIGRTKDEIIGMPRYRLYPPSKVNYYTNLFRDFVKNGKSVGFTVLEIVKKDGTVIPVLSSSAIRQADGRKIVNVVFRNLSKFKCNEIIYQPPLTGQVTISPETTLKTPCKPASSWERPKQKIRKPDLCLV